ncbi:MarR family winged helix-turn-helix transcriptional regulator [Gulosibacter bifidus]|uniref:MarR family winged helix-turn-helix transcriptional regulator n=1 Tax=Gulosibacter bifidus TaxID=272239 RepID=A0ABW5RJ62_9MICO|nr:MarR family winged helix-turn-helix transcriptional regulator [Gulosibacter bifidus]
MKAAASDAWESMYRAQVSIMRDLRNAFTNVGMTMNEYDVMNIVHDAREHRIRMRELNANVLITQSSVSRLVDRLVARGLMSKHEDGMDARGTIVALTDKGVQAFNKANAIHEQNIRLRMEGSLTRDDLNTLTKLSRQLLRKDSSN